MSLVAEIATKLETDLSLSTVYTDTLPEHRQGDTDTDKCVAVMGYSGRSNLRTSGGTAGTRPRFMVMARDVDQAAARAQLEAAEPFLSGFKGTLSGTEYADIYPDGELRLIKSDIGPVSKVTRWVYGQDYDVVRCPA